MSCNILTILCGRFAPKLTAWRPAALFILLAASAGVGYLMLGTWVPISYMKSNPAILGLANSSQNKALLKVQQEPQLGVTYRGNSQAVAALQTQSARPLALASGDLDGDLAADLVTSYGNGEAGIIAVKRGNINAFQTKDQITYQRALRGDVAASLEPQADVYQVPEAPNFLAAGDFDGDQRQDVVAATTGGGLYLLAGDGTGNLLDAQQVSLSGKITAIAAGTFNRNSGLSSVVVGVNGSDGPALLVFEGEDGGLNVQPKRYSLSSQAMALALGNLDNDLFGDVAIAEGHQVEIIHGGGWNNSDPAARIEKLEVPFEVRSIAIGDFIWDRDFRAELALLSPDGNVHIYQRGQLDTRPFTDADKPALMARRTAASHAPMLTLEQQIELTERDKWQASAKETWTDAQQYFVVAGAGELSSQTLTTGNHTTGRRTDDLFVLDPQNQQVHILVDTSTVTDPFNPRVPVSLDVNGSPLAVTAMPQKINASRDLLVLSSAQTEAASIGIAPLATFTVTKTADTNDGVCNADCSLREAINAANNVAGTNTINFNVNGTFTNTLGSFPALGDVNSNNITILGSSPANTVIANTGSGAGHSVLYYGFNANQTFKIQNLTLQNGNTADGFGGGALATGGTGWLVTVDNCVLNNNVSQSTDNGGAISQSGGGNFVIQNGSVISNNTATAAIGGGICVNNSTNVGGLTVTNSTFTGNQATAGAGAGQGGGLWIGVEASGSSVVTISQSTITNNNAGSQQGGGIFTNKGTIQFNRIVGNTAVTGGSGIFEPGGGFTVLANDNWWGCNFGPGATGTGCTGTQNSIGPLFNITSATEAGTTCTITTSAAHGFSVGQVVTIAGVGVAGYNGQFTVTGQSTFSFTYTNGVSGLAASSGGTATSVNASRFLQLRNTATPNIIKRLQTSSLLADIYGRNTGGPVPNCPGASCPLNGLASFPTPAAVIFSNAVLGSLSNNPAQQFVNGGGPTATYTAGNTPGTGSVDAKADNQTTTAIIAIVFPPTIAKAFGATNIPINGTTSLTFTINNPNTNPFTPVALSGITFSDTLPANLVVATPNGLSGVCGGSVTAVAGSNTISLTSGTLAAGAQCTISVNVTGTVDGIYSNTTGVIDATESGPGVTSNTANLTVINPPHIVKAFGAASIPLNSTTSLTFTLDSNSNQNLTLSGVAFTDNLPAGLVVATPGNLSNTCGGTATAANGASTVSLSGVSLAPNTSCTVSVTVQGTTAGVKNNSVTPTATNAGGVTGNTSNASIIVVAPPTISKAFNPTTIALNASSTLSFTVTNPNTASALSGVAFTDNLPAGVVVATTPNVTGSCGSGTITATAGSGTISLSGGTLTASPAAGSTCTFSADVTGTTAGSKSNTTGAVTSTEGGTGTTSNTAVLTVVAPPSIAKVFNPSTIALNATTSLTFTITNPAANTVALTGVAFTDTLPTGLTVANASATVCGGTLTTTAPTGIALSGATINTNSQCQFSVTVTGAASGQYTNTTGNVTSTNGGTGNTATANLTVAAPPTITKGFGASSIPLNGTTSLTFTIQNPNTTLGLTGLAFTDNLPAGLVVAATPNLSNTCGGTATAVAGASSVSLSAGTLAASGSCTVSVDVQGTTAGVKNNSVQITSTEGGTGNTSNASITVVAPPVIIKAFGAASIPLGGSTSLTFTIQNNNTTTTLTGVGFSDTLPAGLVISTPNGLAGGCGGGGTITATAGTNVISLSGGSITASSQCTFSVNVTGTAAGLQTNTTGNVSSTEGGTGGTASASVKVEAPPSIAKVFNPNKIVVNATTSLTFTITNPAGNVDPLTGVAFTDTLPTGLTVANASATVCGGTLTTTAPTGIALSGATINTNSQCQFSVTVTGAVQGGYANTTGNVTSTNGGTGNTATANVLVLSPTATNADVTGRITDAGSNPIAGAIISLSGTQNRLTITDANGNYRFDNVETAGFYVVTPSRPNYTFSPAQRSFSQLGQHTDAAFTASANSGSVINPLDTSAFFVRQQYLDFLGREPDELGFTSWVNEINNCPAGDTSCDRLHVSELFFRSGEFQDRGYYIYRFYSAAFGRKPDYAEFTPDMAHVSGFLTTDQLETAKMQFVTDFMARPAFAAKYNGLSNAAYVDALINTAQVSLANRQTIIDALNNGAIDRAHALRMIAESGEIYAKYYNQAFVVMEYFGYLRRDPDALYTEWIDELNQSGDVRHMVDGFVNSSEYRGRFPH